MIADFTHPALRAPLSRGDLEQANGVDPAIAQICIHGSVGKGRLGGVIQVNIATLQCKFYREGFSAVRPDSGARSSALLNSGVWV